MALICWSLTAASFIEAASNWGILAILATACAGFGVAAGDSAAEAERTDCPLAIVQLSKQMTQKFLIISSPREEDTVAPARSRFNLSCRQGYLAEVNSFSELSRGGEIRGFAATAG